MVSSFLSRRVSLAAFFCLLASLMVSATAHPTMALAENAQPAPPPPLQHGPTSSTPAGKSVPVTVFIADVEEILEVRLYFKTMTATDYFFLSMTGSSKGIYTGSLPPTKNDTKGIDYLLLFKNSQGEIRKTKPFRILVLNDYNAFPPVPGELEILTERGTPEAENHEFAVPFKLVTTPEPLLAYAVEDPYPLHDTPAPDSGKNIFRGFSGLGGVSFSIKIGGVGFFYKGFSGH